MKFQYYKMLWPEYPIPAGEPCRLFYEVDPNNDTVLRMVEEMPSGDLIKNDLVKENEVGPPCITLIEGSFREAVTGVEYELMDKVEFERLFSNADYKTN